MPLHVSKSSHSLRSGVFSVPVQSHIQPQLSIPHPPSQFVIPAARQDIKIGNASQAYSVTKCITRSCSAILDDSRQRILPGGGHNRISLDRDISGAMQDAYTRKGLQDTHTKKAPCWVKEDISNESADQAGQSAVGGIRIHMQNAERGGERYSAWAGPQYEEVSPSVPFTHEETHSIVRKQLQRSASAAGSLSNAQKSQSSELLHSASVSAFAIRQQLPSEYSEIRDSSANLKQNSSGQEHDDQKQTRGVSTKKKRPSSAHPRSAAFTGQQKKEDIGDMHPDMDFQSAEAVQHIIRVAGPDSVKVIPFYDHLGMKRFYIDYKMSEVHEPKHVFRRNVIPSRFDHLDPASWKTANPQHSAYQTESRRLLFKSPPMAIEKPVSYFGSSSVFTKAFRYIPNQKPTKLNTRKGSMPYWQHIPNSSV